MNIEKPKPFLLCTYIIPFAFWIFDLITTYYAINYLSVAEETNPLGWPLGALGALIFYIPAYIFTHLLLFRIQNKYSCWAALLVTALALGVGILNLGAGLHNLNVAGMYTGNSLANDFAGFFNNILTQTLLCTIALLLLTMAIIRTPQIWKKL